MLWEFRDIRELCFLCFRVGLGWGGVGKAGRSRVGCGGVEWGRVRWIGWYGMG